jgi:hypothetical protein
VGGRKRIVGGGGGKGIVEREGKIIFAVGRKRNRKSVGERSEG